MDLVYPHILSFPILFVFLFHFRASFGIFAFILKTNSAYTSSKFNALHRIDIDKSTNRRTNESTNQPIRTIFLASPSFPVPLLCIGLNEPISKLQFKFNKPIGAKIVEEFYRVLAEHC